ncbi:MAG: ATP-binding protein [Alphaproteobacteria bacterium]
MFIISCLLLEMFTFIIYNQSRLNKNSNDWVIHSYEVLRVGRLALLDSIQLADSGRDYLQTGSSVALKNYTKLDKTLDQKLGELAKITSDNPEQKDNIFILYDKIKNLKKVMGRNIDVVNQRRTDFYSLRAAEQAIRQGGVEIRAAYDKFVNAEGKILEQRRAKAETEQKNYLWTLFMGAILGMGALVIANLVIFSLITKNMHAEEKLRKSEELFATIINGINDGVFDYNVVEDTVSYSPSYKVIWGYGEEELTKQHNNFYSFVHPDDLAKAQETMRAYMARETDTYCNIFRVRHRDGNWVCVMSRGIGIWNEKGEIQRLIGTHVDITPQKQREEELNYFIKENERQREELAYAKEKAESANQAKTDFLATMSHEIRTPMNAVIGLSRMLKETPLDAKQLEMTDTLYVNAEILLRLVNDLLDLSRIEAGQIDLEERSFTFTNVFKAVHAMLDSQASAKGLVLELKNNLDDHTYRGDPTRIQQILANLIGNAVKFTSKGSITVVCNGKVKNNKADIKISVSDTGVGISADKLDSVFEKFVQADQTISRRFGGSGLGLAICKSLAQLMGGDITVSSKPGEGSVFVLSMMLPIVAEKKVAAAPIVPITTGTVPLSGMVLIVEDYAPNIMVATLMLEHLGYHAEVAKSGIEAIRKIESRTSPYTAILMDVQMQDMDGFEATRRIREIEKQKGFQHYIIGVTAHALAGDRDKCIDAGMNDYMSKPIHPELLAQKLSGLSRAA